MPAWLWFLRAPPQVSAMMSGMEGGSQLVCSALVQRHTRKFITRTAPMAMTMNGQVQLAADRQAVWAMLNEPTVLKNCIPGCESLDKDSDTEFRAVATIKIGPVKARWKGKVRFTDLDPPNGYRIAGEGEGGVAGFAKGGATVSLADKDGGTLLSYVVEAQIGGKLAQLGQRLINSAAKKTADDFFANFAAAVCAQAGGVEFGDGLSIR